MNRLRCAIVSSANIMVPIRKHVNSTDGTVLDNDAMLVEVGLDMQRYKTSEAPPQTDEM